MAMKNTYWYIIISVLCCFEWSYIYSILLHSAILSGVIFPRSVYWSAVLKELTVLVILHLGSEFTQGLSCGRGIIAILGQNYIY